jgi:hypothetical protein
MRLDHVLLAVADLETAAAALEARHGIDAYEGGSHPQWGTANRIVPLRETYLELVSVVDGATARDSAFGRWVEAETRAEPSPFAWCVSPTSLDETCARLGLEIQAGSRAIPSGETLGWRLAGLEQAARHPWLPFFIDWSEGTPHPGRRDGVAEAAVHLDVEGDVEELAVWLGEHSLPVGIRPGRAGVTAVSIDRPSGRVSLRRRVA